MTRRYADRRVCRRQIGLFCVSKQAMFYWFCALRLDWEQTEGALASDVAAVYEVK